MSESKRAEIDSWMSTQAACDKLWIESDIESEMF